MFQFAKKNESTIIYMIHAVLSGLSRIEIAIEKCAIWLKPITNIWYDQEHVHIYHVMSDNCIKLVKSMKPYELITSTSAFAAVNGTSILVNHVKVHDGKRECKTRWLNSGEYVDVNTSVPYKGLKFIMMELIDSLNAHHLVFLENEEFNFYVSGNKLTADFFRFYSTHIHNNGCDMSEFKVSLLDGNMHQVEFTQEDSLTFEADNYVVTRKNAIVTKEEEEDGDFVMEE